MATDRFNGVVASKAIKVRCVVGAEADVATLEDEQTIEGISVSAGDRVLLTAQTDPIENGAWDVVSGGPWIRSADWDGNRDVEKGSTVWAGALGQDDKLWQVQTDGVIQPGTTAVTITELFNPAAPSSASLADVTSIGDDTLGNDITISSADPTLTLQDNNNAGSGAAGNLIFVDSAAAEQASARLSSLDLVLDSVNGNILMNSANGYIRAVDSFIAGDPGTEAGGILVGGASYTSALKISDIGDTHLAEMILHRHSSSLPATIVTARSASTDDSHGLTDNNSFLFLLTATGWDGATYQRAAEIGVSVDGVSGAGDMPGRLVFSTTPDGGFSPLERLRIDSAGITTVTGELRVRTTGATATPPSGTGHGIGRIEMWDADSTDQLLGIGYEGTAHLKIRNYIYDGQFTLAATNISGTERQFLEHDPGGDTFLSSAQSVFLRVSNTSIVFGGSATNSGNYYSGSQVTRTTSRAAGGWLLYNDKTHPSAGTFSRALSEPDIEAGQFQLFYGFTTSITAADPGATNFKFNNASMSLATEMYINDSSNNSIDAARVLDNLVAGDVLRIANTQDASEWIVLEIGVPVDNTGWWTIPVTVLASNGTNFGSDDCVIDVQWNSTASALADGTVDNSSLKWDNTGGEWVENLLFRQLADRVAIYGTDDDTNTDVVIEFRNNSGTLRGEIGVGNQNSDHVWNSFQAGADMRIRGQNAGGQARTGLDFSPDGAMEITGVTNIFLNTGTTGAVSGIDIATGVVLYYNDGVQLQTSSEGVQAVNPFNGEGGTVYERMLTESYQDWAGSTSLYRFDQSTSATDPGIGDIRFNSATPANVTTMYVDELSEYGNHNMDWLWQSVSVGDLIILRGVDSTTRYWIGSISALPTDNTGWWTVPVTHIQSGSLPTNAELMNLSIQYASKAISAPNLDYFNFTFSTTTTQGDPGAGYLRFSTADTTTANNIWIDDEDADGNDLQNVFGQLVAGSTVRIRNADASFWVDYLSYSIAIEDTGYWRLAVQYQKGSGATVPSNDEALICEISNQQMMPPPVTPSSIIRVGAGGTSSGWYEYSPVRVRSDAGFDFYDGGTVRGETYAQSTEFIVRSTGVLNLKASTINMQGSAPGNTKMTFTSGAATMGFRVNLITWASDAVTAGLRISEGVAPSAPVDGDVWVTAAGEFMARLNGVTVDLADTGGAGSVTSVSAGNGMDFTTITGAGPVTMGTPGTIGVGTGNAVTATSHTHALDNDIVNVQSGGAANRIAYFIDSNSVEGSASFTWDGSELNVGGTLVDVDNSAAATATTLRARDSSGGISMAVNGSGAGQINQISSAGAAEDTWIAMARNGGVQLNYNNVAQVATTSLGTQFDLPLYLFQRAAANTDSGTFGQIWVNSADDHLYFTNDTGTDYQISGASGSTTLAGLTDTNITSPANGNILMWDSTPGEWIDATTLPAAYTFSNRVLFTGSVTGQSMSVSDDINLVDGAAVSLGTGSGGTGDIKILFDGTEIDITALSAQRRWNWFDGPEIRWWDSTDTDWIQFRVTTTNLDITESGLDRVNWPAAGTLDLSMNDNTIDQPILQDYAIESQAINVTGTTVTFTYSNGPVFECDMEAATGNVTATLSGGPPAGTYGQITVKMTQDTTVRTLSWAGGTFRWAGGTAHPVTTTANGFTIYTFETWDGGTTWYGAGADYS